MLEPFRSYLRGMETNHRFDDPRYIIGFRSYLRGMETGTYRDRQIFANIIPILPTRHGNSGFPGMKGGKVVDSDPTYEAWKRAVKRGLYFNGHYSDPTYEAWKPHKGIFPQIFILNSDPTYEAWKQRIASALGSLVKRFRSYLRGMETNHRFDDPRYIIGFRSYLRGMETGTYRDRQIFANIIPILPTRHGNSGFPGMKGGKVVDSDPTYEAWKRAVKRGLYFNGHYSDPTYEAWKPHKGIFPQIFILNSDPTYEAWKQRIASALGSLVKRFRSYLRGMETRLVCV